MGEFFIKNWEGIIAILGLILSLSNSIYILINNRKALEIKEIFYTKRKIKDKIYYEFNMIIINKSVLPISISDIKLQSDSNQYDVKLDKSKVSELKNTNGESTTFYSSSFPINLNGLEASREMLIFSLDKELLTEVNELILMTSRGKVNIEINFQDKYITTSEYLNKILKNG